MKSKSIFLPLLAAIISISIASCNKTGPCNKNSQTPREQNAADFAGDGAMAEKVAAETPVKRWASAAEVAELTLFLASQKASYMQGNIVPIDGGWLLK